MPDKLIKKRRTEAEFLHLDYVAGIDGLRALAVLAVIIYHIDSLSFLPGGFSGVDIFFVISGYVISKSLSRKNSLHIISYLSEFYKKRLIRILPALTVCLLITSLLSTLLIPSSWLSSTNSETGLAAFFGFSNYALVWHTNGYFSPRVDFNPYLHTWSLGVEEQFYLIFPFLFLIWLKLRKRGSIYQLLSCGLLFGLTFLSLAFACYEIELSQNRAFYLLPSRFWELAAGALLFKLHSNQFCLSKSRIVSELFLVPGILLLIIGFLYSSQSSFPYPWALVPVISTMLLICGVTNNTNRLSVFHRFLQSNIMIYIGKISFSLYLWHWPVATLFRWTFGFDKLEYILIYLPVVFILAIISYHAVESPVRTSHFIRRQSNWKLIVSGLFIISISYSTAQFIVYSQPLISLSVTKDAYTWYPYAYTPEKQDKVYSDKNYADRQLFVIGDSHTAAYRTMLKQISTQLGIKVHEYEEGGCSFANLLKPMDQEDGCQEFFDHTLKEIKRMVQPTDLPVL